MQVPAPFDYARASSVDEAIELLERFGPESRLVAGGHSLLPMMKLRLATPEHLIDINPLEADLRYIREDGERIHIGALTRHRDLLESNLLARHAPVFFDAEVAIRGRDGERAVDMADFHQGPFTTAVGAGEMLVEVRIPIREHAGSAYQKVERRAGDWAIAAASVAVWMDGGLIRDIGIALSAVGLTTVHVSRAEELLRGKGPREELLAQACEIASEDCSPTSDGRGPADYKRHLARVLTERALRRAMSRALNQEA